MLGATLRVKSLVADLCRANSGVSTLVLDTNDLFIDEVLMRFHPTTYSACECSLGKVACGELERRLYGIVTTSRTGR